MFCFISTDVDIYIRYKHFISVTLYLVNKKQSVFINVACDAVYVPVRAWKVLEMSMNCHAYGCVHYRCGLVGCGGAVLEALARGGVYLPRMGVSRQPRAHSDAGQPTSPTPTLQVFVAALVPKSIDTLPIFTVPCSETNIFCVQRYCCTR